MKTKPAERPRASRIREERPGQRRRRITAPSPRDGVFQRLFERLPLPLYIYDRRTLDVLYANQAALRQYGYSRDEFLRLTARDIRPPEEVPRFLASLAGMNRTPVSAGFVTTGRWHHRRKDASLFAVETAWCHTTLAGRQGVAALVHDISDRLHAEETLRLSHEQLRRLARRIESVREEQQARVARELHDELGQQMTALKMDLSWLQSRLRSPGRERVERMLEQVDATLATIRQIASDLRPAALDDLGLEAAVQALVRGFVERTGLVCELDVRLDGARIDRARSLAVYRILQEALTNVARHSGARRAEIRLRALRGDLVLEVADDGRGIAPRRIDGSGSLGLVGMHERARALHGEVALESAPGKGTRLRLRLPLSSRKARRRR